jgi:tetratricopeptide (TPR) repeat protein
MAKKRKKKSYSTPKAANRPSQRLLVELEKAESLVRRKLWIEAGEALTKLDQRYPNRVEVLTNLSHVYYELHDALHYEAVCEQLFRIMPDDPDFALALAGAYVINGRPMLALQTFRRFSKRWPDHERADDVRQSLVDLEGGLDDFLADLGFSGPDGFELAVLHDEVRALLEQGEYRKVRQVAEQLLSRRPDFTPALNNLSLAYFAEGRIDQGIAAAQQVLALDANNFHALSNLTRYLCLKGRMSEAKEWAEQLKAVELEAVDVWIKKAEALSYLGDDQGVLDAFEGARRAGCLEPPSGKPVLYHLAAVAAMRLGQENEARRYWQRASKLAPGLESVRDNLADLRQPVGERHAPWAYNLANWVDEKVVRDLSAQLGSALRRGPEAGRQVARRYLRQHPELVGLTPALLDRGDPFGRELALRLALMARTPEMLAALHDFALSQRGPDAMRSKAARAVSEAKLLPSGPVRLWSRGEWQEVMLLGFELHSEPLGEHQPEVLQWLEEATLAMKQLDSDRAEHLLLRALAVEPDALDLLNNLAVTYELQGRTREAEALTRLVLERDPGNVFANARLSRLHLDRGEIDEAEALLEPLFSRQRFHFSEFSAFCNIRIELCIAQGEIEGARSWLDMWTSVDPEAPPIKYWRERLSEPGLLRRPFKQRMEGQKGKKKRRTGRYSF